jgi:hypothetical protein
MRRAVRGVFVLVLALVSCRSPETADIPEACGANGECPQGFTCSPRDQRCYQSAAICLLQSCATCGNGVVEGHEECDGADLSGSAARRTCTDLDGDGVPDDGVLTGGTLSCHGDCTLDTSRCTRCGDGVRQDGEECDDPLSDGSGDFGGATCQSRGATAGALACTPRCRIDDRGCTTCGDGVREPGEACDGADLGGETCASRLGERATGTLSCAPGCDGFDTSACQVCGNRVREGTEACDGADLGDRSCRSEGFDGGVLSCASRCEGEDDCTCTLNTSACHACGDGIRNGPEDCDGVGTCRSEGGTASCGDATCVSFGYVALLGLGLGCTASCAYDLSGCFTETCGNGRLDPGEPCDTTAAGDPLGGKTCADLDGDGTPGEPGDFDGGTLTCLFPGSPAGCMLDTSGCFRCGDGVKNGAELCDGPDLGDATCKTEGFSDGALACNDTCDGLDTSACVFVCGDGVKNGAELCDGPDLGGATCATEGFDGGALTCRPTCDRFNTSGCYRCGDGVKNGAELCDGSELGGATCVTQGFAGGALACTKTCDAFVTSGCHGCGDGVKNGAELCDGADLGGATCASQGGFAGGALTCAETCDAFDVGGCFQCFSCRDCLSQRCECLDGSDGVNGRCETGGTCDTSCRSDHDCCSPWRCFRGTCYEPGS